MGKIVLLDELTINKIAAGEVIERPASVVKEMVENSIDAGADKITVEIKNGGISFIKVSDNGKGIAEDDLEIAFERHATSKIRSAEDLDTVTSMGFRGEALASIAAVANVEVVSKPEVQAAGYKVIVSAGNVLGKKEVGCPSGTSITVTDLFFNTPVRYKFLKKDYTETGYIEDVITRIALINPNISFKLINAGKTVIQTNGNGNMKDVIYSIYGKDIANSVLPVKYKYEGIEINGVIGKPEIARSNRINQIFFVNKRYIKDKTLSAATSQGYKGLIPIGKFGFVVLDIEVEPSKVDVNVHPAKLEVRFEEENKVFQAIYHSIKDTLLKADLVANTSKESSDKKLTPSEVQRKMSRREESFEKRLAEKMKEKEESPKSKGLFGHSRQSKKIEKYNDEESKIKTNNLIEELYNNKNKEAEKETIKEESADYETIFDTSDVLEKLKKMKDEMQEEIKVEKNNIVEDKTREIDDIDDLELTEEELSKLNAKVESFLGEASKIKEKNNKIIAGEYEEEKENKEDTEQNKIDEIEAKLEALKEGSKKLDEIPNIPNLEEIKSVSEKEIKEEVKDNTTGEDALPKGIISLKQSKEDTEELKEKEEKLEYINDKINQLKENPNVITDDFKEMYTKLFGTTPKTAEDLKKEEEQRIIKEKASAIDIVKDNVSIFDDEEEYQLPQYRFIGIAFKTYIILEMDKELYILDQHAAHERIMYEKVKANYYSETEKDSQILLLPDVITLTHKEMDILKENMGMFRKAGFELEEFGENTIKLTGCPTVCLDINTKELFLETLDEINTVARTARQEKEEKFIATVACKAAVKAHMALDEKEVEALMDKLLRLPNPFTCPHGRPTAIKMTQYDIERKFARK